MSGFAIPIGPQRVRCRHLMGAHSCARRSAVALASKIVVVVCVKDDAKRIRIGHDHRNFEARNPRDRGLASSRKPYPCMKSLT